MSEMRRAFVGVVAFWPEEIADVSPAGCRRAAEIFEQGANARYAVNTRADDPMQMVRAALIAARDRELIEAGAIPAEEEIDAEEYAHYQLEAMIAEEVERIRNERNAKIEAGQTPNYTEEDVQRAWLNGILANYGWRVRRIANWRGPNYG